MHTPIKQISQIHKGPGVYSIINTTNDKKYIGSSKNVNHRFNTHRSLLRKNKHGNTHLQHSWNKYSEDVFEFRILEPVDVISDLVAREQYWMDKFDSSNDEYGYNICPRANKSAMSEETKQKISRTKTGVPVKAETKEKMRIARTGKKSSEETRAKLRIATGGKNNPSYGKQKSQETKDKISKTKMGCVGWNKGIPCSEKQKDSLRNARLKAPNPIDPLTGRFLKGVSPYLPFGENSTK